MPCDKKKLGGLLALFGIARGRLSKVKVKRRKGREDGCVTKPCGKKLHRLLWRFP